MLPLEDPKWKQLKGGYRILYDASPALRRFEQGEEVWDELWQELHHQRDVGEASYAAVPQLVRIAQRRPVRDWNFYGLVSTIEIERHRKTNPPLPEWLQESYRIAWRDMLDLALSDLKSAKGLLAVQSILGAIALAKGLVKLGAMVAHTDESEIEELLQRLDRWSEFYEPDRGI